MLEIIVFLMMLSSIIIELYENRKISLEEQIIIDRKENKTIEILMKFINKEITQEQKTFEIKKIEENYKKELKEYKKNKRTKK